MASDVASAVSEGKAVEDENMQPIHPPYSLQTVVGMVVNSGLPASRHLAVAPSNEKIQIIDPPSARVAQFPPVGQRSWLGRDYRYHGRFINSFESYTKIDWSMPERQAIADTAISCLRQSGTIEPTTVQSRKKEVDCFLSNVEALRNPVMTMYQLMTCIKSRNRLDLEQAAGAVVAALVNDGRMEDACTLVKELSGVLAVSDMSTTELELQACRQTAAKSHAAALSHASQKLYDWSRKAKGAADQMDPGLPTSAKDLVLMLMRVRRVAPSNRCLLIPAWLFEEAGIDPPSHHSAFLDWLHTHLDKKSKRLGDLNGARYPTKDPEADSLVLSRKLFRAIQKRVNALFQFWKPEKRLRRDIHVIENRVIYATDWVNRQLRETSDAALVAHWFFQYQRRLQLKVVSDSQWTKFLAKGEGKTLYQNNLSLKSTFEVKLEEIASKSGADAMGAGDDTLQLIDHVCLLMKTYVDVYGGGNKGNLVFKKGIGGGSGRGPVDEYNLLCDILQTLKEKAKNENLEKLPGPVYKFLAKDIMHWNNAWEDDAFACGKIHGWEAWVVERGLL